MLRNLLVISLGYPTEKDPTYTFVEQLCVAMAKHNLDITVIAPQKVLKLLHKKSRHPYKRIVQLQNGGKITIFQPAYLSLSNYKIGKFSLSEWMFGRSVNMVLNKNKIKPDTVYGHFWWCGYAGYEYARDNNIPLFVATGESVIQKAFSIKCDQNSFSKFVKGVICVSGKNRDESIKMGLTTIDKCGVFPNAIDENIFHKQNKKECREQLGLPQEDFIMAFVGWFIERKGPMRVAEAIKKIGGVKSLFIGGGGQKPICDGILYCGSLPHEAIPQYLCAADCFVLPTLHEGCCNAVIEALACGLPVVSSNLPFNWDVLDESNSILVDPLNVDEIAQAIKKLRDDKDYRNLLSEGALRKAEDLTIDKRATSIISFMESRMTNS